MPPGTTGDYGPVDPTPSEELRNWARDQIVASGFPALDAAVRNYRPSAGLTIDAGYNFGRDMIDQVIALYGPAWELRSHKKVVFASRLESLGVPLSAFRFPWDTNKAATVEIDPTLPGWNIGNAKWYFMDPSADDISALLGVAMVAAFVIGASAFAQYTGIGVAGGSAVSDSSLIALSQMEAGSGAWASGGSVAMTTGTGGGVVAGGGGGGLAFEGEESFISANTGATPGVSEIGTVIDPASGLTWSEISTGIALPSLPAQITQSGLTEVVKRIAGVTGTDLLTAAKTAAGIYTLVRGTAGAPNAVYAKVPQRAPYQDTGGLAPNLTPMLSQIALPLAVLAVAYFAGN